jgi:hypothetical protein
MKVHRLQIEQQMAQIRIDSQLANLSIEASQRHMTVNRQDARMTVRQEAPEVELDMQDFRNKNGIQDIKSFMDDNTAEAYRHARQSIRETTRDGNFVGTLPAGGNSIGRLAKSKLLEADMPEMNSGRVPYGPVKMKGDIGAFDIDWSSHDLRIEWDDYQAPQITVEPKASVDIAIEQEPYLEFTVIEQEIPPEKGTAVDAEA